MNQFSHSQDPIGTPSPLNQLLCKYFLSNTHKIWSNNGILLPKLFGPTVRKNGSSDREILLKFETEDREFAKILRSLEQCIQTVKGQNNFW